MQERIKDIDFQMKEEGTFYTPIAVCIFFFLQQPLAPFSHSSPKSKPMNSHILENNQMKIVCLVNHGVKLSEAFTESVHFIERILYKQFVAVSFSFIVLSLFLFFFFSHFFFFFHFLYFRPLEKKLILLISMSTCVSM